MRSVLATVVSLFLLGQTALAQDPPVEDVAVDSVGASYTQPYKTDSPFSILQQSGSVDIRKVPPEKLEELKNSEDYWYANTQPKKEEPAAAPRKKPDNLFNQGWFLNLLWLLILFSFIGVVIWYLASSNIRLFRKASRRIANEEEAETPAEDIFEISYEKEIARAVGAGDYRAAVRLWYLRTLKELATRNVIAWRQETPNGTYVSALYGSRYYQPFFRLTRNFEYVWYGGFSPSAEAYQMMQTDFKTFLNSLA